MANPDAHPLCTIDYYNNAMDMLDGDDVLFICTSDDIKWCEENIKRKNIVYNYQDLAHDMCLISKCHDHIMANSTFSWWGSWLSQNKNKKINTRRYIDHINKNKTITEGVNDILVSDSLDLKKIAKQLQL